MNVYLGELYKEVEYIQSSGTQRIDTGVNVSNDSTYGFELKCNFDVARESVMDMGGDNSDVRRYGVQVGIGNWQISRPMYGTNDDYANFVYNPTPQTGVDYTMVYNYNGNRSWSLNGTTYASGLSVGSFTYNYNWNIFCQTLNNGTYTRFSKFKLYYMKIYHGTTLVRDFIPCYRVSDNVIGLFDKVNNKFYANSGTGTFTKGNDVKVFQAELKNAYIGEVWTPGSNTIMYLPLEKDGNDYSGNNHNLTWSGTPSYTTSGGTKQVTNFNGSTLGMINSLSGSYTNYTFNVRAKPTSNSFGLIFWNTNTTNNAWEKNVYLNWVLTSYEQASKYDFGYQYRAGSGSYTNLYGTTNRTLNTWYNFCVIGSSNGVTGYVNGTQIFITSASSTINLVSGQNDIGGFYRVYHGDKGTYFNGYLSEFIFENKTWTAAEISHYYDLTKSNYGL